MKAINLRDKIGELTDQNCLKIDRKKLDNVCLFHASKNTCRYIILTAEGFFCCKNTNIAESMDDLVASGTMKATGDNCEGLGFNGSSKKESKKENKGEETGNKNCKKEKGQT